VARWLVGEGWVLLAERWRVPAGELDLVMRDPANVVVGIEVRTRRHTRAGAAVESVGAQHVARLRRTLVAYAAQLKGARTPLRVDLVTVVPTTGPDGQDARRWRAIARSDPSCNRSTVTSSRSRIRPTIG
jgi:Holliday junction resolvase-like predicted endonuclease